MGVDRTYGRVEPPTVTALQRDWRVRAPLAILRRAVLPSTHRHESYVLPASGAFPATRRDWLVERVESGDDGHRDASSYVMELYAPALEAYLRRSAFRAAGEPTDLVAGFFASRLGRTDYFRKWLDSGVAFRRWLINGFVFYLREEARSRRAGCNAEPDDAAEELFVEPDAFADFDRAWVREVVRRSCERASEICGQAGRSVHWHLFLRHHLHGADYAALAAELGVPAARAPGMVRTAAATFRRAVVEILVRDGVPPDELDEELRRLLGASGR
jgi:DNA-directed RNA polymerase specialized sigma24 family protein